MTLVSTNARPPIDIDSYEIRTHTTESTPSLYSWEIHRMSDPGVPVLRGKLMFTCPDRARLFASAALELWLRDPGRGLATAATTPINPPARS